MTAIPPRIREILACPRCRGALDDANDLGRASLVCRACRLSYPVEAGIPILLIERAESVPR